MNTLFSRFALIALCITFVSGCSVMNLLPAIAPGVDAEADIKSAFPYESRFVSVLGSDMHYVDVGQGPVVIMLHGNPTSNYLWRNIIPAVSQQHRVIAPDLIGMGKSDKPPIDYTLQDHTAYITAFIQEMGLTDVTLVLHDWGGGIGLNYLAAHPDNVKAIAVMEAVIKPFSWDNVDMMTEYMFRNLRDQEVGHELLIEQNYFVEKLLPMFSGREFSETEMAKYRAPFQSFDSRKPVRRWPQEIPFDGEPARNYAQMTTSFNALQTFQRDNPVLVMFGEPGAIFTEDFVTSLRSELPSADFQPIGPGLHYLQESQPTNIANALVAWLNNHNASAQVTIEKERNNVSE